MFVYVLMSCSVYVLMLLRSYVLMFWCSYVILFLVGSETDVESEWARSETEADSKWNRGQFQWTASGPNIISGPSWTLCGVYWAPWALGIRFHPDPKYKDRQLGRLIPGCDPHRDWPVGGLWIAGRALGRSQTGINLPSCRSLYFGSGWRQASQASQSKPVFRRCRIRFRPSASFDKPFWLNSYFHSLVRPRRQRFSDPRVLLLPPLPYPVSPESCIWQTVLIKFILSFSGQASPAKVQWFLSSVFFRRCRIRFRSSAYLTNRFWLNSYFILLSGRGGKGSVTPGFCFCSLYLIRFHWSLSFDKPFW
jgi:hypothetical protein